MTEKIFKPMGVFLLMAGVVFMHLAVYIQASQWVIHGAVLFILGTSVCFAVFSAEKVARGVAVILLLLATFNFAAFLAGGDIPHFHIIVSLPAGISLVYFIARPHLQYAIKEIPHF